MTEKRFTYEYDEYNGTLFDNKMNTFYHIEDSDKNIEVLCNRLNLLVEENEQLKQVNRNLGDFRNFITEKNVSNEKQRKELQLQMLRLYNYFENWFEDEMSSTAFSEMWDNVKEDEKWEKR